MSERARFHRRAMLGGALAASLTGAGAAGLGVAANASPSGATSSGRVMQLPGSTAFKAGTNGYHTFRIPAVVRTSSGDLLAFAEGRVDNPSDFGNIDMVMRRSTDDGRTWGPLQVIWSDGTNKVGNPVPVVDSYGEDATGDVVLLVIRTVVENGEGGERRPFLLRSSDHGKTWSDPEDITDDVKLPDWGHFVFGPGHAIQLSRGQYAGRMVAPGNHSSTSVDGAGASGVHLAYSDDRGRTWQLGARDEEYDNYVNGNESQVVELRDGTLYQAIRDQHGEAPSNRAYVTSSDGGESYDGALTPEPQLWTPVVQAGLQRMFATDQGDDQDLLLFSSPKGEERTALYIWRSLDEGTTWEEALKILHEPSAYSDLVKLSDSRVGLLYECGESTPYQEISFARVLVSNLLP